MTVKHTVDSDTLPEPSQEEKRKFFDEQAKAHLGMSGADFIRDYKAGRWPDPDADPDVMFMVTLLPFAA